MDPVIEITNLRKTYGEKTAVADVSFAVERGEIFGILGPNGAGKTTTVEALAGLRQADGGSTVVLGVDTQRDPAAVRERLGIQLQSSRLPAKLKVAEAMHLYASFYAEPADTDELLELLGLTEKKDTAFADLSGGQQQRLSIALALVGNPQVAILDELTTGLDPQARRDTWALIERVRDSGVTIVLVTHFMDEAERLCDRLVVIDGGRVVAEGRPRELVAATDERAFRMRLPAGTDPAVVDRLSDLPEVSSVTEDDGEHEVRGNTRVLSAVILALASQDVVPDEIRTLSRTLEDLFVEVTGARPMETVS
ncbi:ABC transporter ATP-binding protein [Georgenia subflava]|uniref:ATP-binding cassette domain-containing protein n=1 Tax=Georgenia subflava TaxID=1622177 RepID=A0A6N7EM63_9MICO|nr:ABC transporter ATP-binding protein [Georgenia subflava]MPV38218.1 ATP-binding cassette domain-containing protein [Georgenia subflava]